jgi:hypothetical protein
MKNSKKSLIETMLLLAVLSDMEERSQEEKNGSLDSRDRQDFLSELTDEEAGKFIKNIANKGKGAVGDFFKEDSLISNMEDFLKMAFIWEDSNEGKKYWQNVWKRFDTPVSELKKGQYFFDKLTPEQKSQFTDAFKKGRKWGDISDYLKESFRDKAQFIKSGFRFDESSQGIGYWVEIAEGE